jgi:superfamily II DNA or RNA helicase
LGVVVIGANNRGAVQDETLSETKKDALREKITREETLLAELDQRREAARVRPRVLQSQLAVISDSAPSTPTDIPPPNTVAEKVALFRGLFRGRQDVFPRLWVNDRKGTKGYAPACFNEWVRGVCEKPRVKCGECPNQAFIPVEDQVVLDHLQGRHVIGVYPLLPDETCWFLAADFDKATWQEDVGAFVETCRAMGIAAAVERSRSGNGAHVWFFFSAPVAAAVARRMACYLITETMARRHELSMESYDRLFPNQDTLPRGGFGNLIALPLQHEPRSQGNTVFLDQRFEPYPDQWAYLASVQRLEPPRVEAIAQDAVRKGGVVGVRIAEPHDNEEAAPWMRAPSGRPRTLRVPGPLPKTVTAARAQRLFVEKAGLPSALLNQIKRLAAFQNPEFYKRQSMRLSTALTPRVIACAEELPDHIALPRGCEEDLAQCLADHGIGLRIEDQRCAGEPIEVRFQGELSRVQERAAHELLAHDIGVFVAPPGAGKTVLGTYLIARRACSTLVLVHRRPLLDQWVTQIAMFLGLEEKDIGRVGAGKRKLTGRIDVAMIQSLVREGRVDDLVAGYGHVIVDECHHVPAFSFERVLAEIKARYVTGLTATPQRRDGHQPIAEMQLGPVRYAVEAKSEAAGRPFEHHLFVRETGFRVSEAMAGAGIQAIYRALVQDERRNQLIIDDVLRALDEGRSPILLTERKDHLMYLAEQLRGHAPNLVVLHGGMTDKERRGLSARLAALPAGEKRLVLATGRYIGEGFDDARLDTLFLAMPVSWKGTLVQYTGRLHRRHPAKRDVRIFDYADSELPVLRRMIEKRLKACRAIGYTWRETPADTRETAATDSEPSGSCS